MLVCFLPPKTTPARKKNESTACTATLAFVRGLSPTFRSLSRAQARILPPALPLTLLPLPHTERTYDQESNSRFCARLSIARDGCLDSTTHARNPLAGVHGQGSACRRGRHDHDLVSPVSNLTLSPELNNFRLGRFYYSHHSNVFAWDAELRSGGPQGRVVCRASKGFSSSFKVSLADGRGCDCVSTGVMAATHEFKSPSGTPYKWKNVGACRTAPCIASGERTDFFEVGSQGTLGTAQNLRCGSSTLLSLNGRIAFALRELTRESDVGSSPI